MTVIEFFDRAALKNIASALFCNPDRVIMIGHDVKPIYKSFDYFRPLIAKHGKAVDFIAKSANRNDVQEIISVLSEIVETHNDCVFDLTGGEDLYLVAVGCIMSKYPDRVQCQRFDFKNEKLIDCDADGTTCEVETFDVFIDDLIEMHGGKIVTNPYDRYYKEPWKLTYELAEDVANMWEAMKGNNGAEVNTAAWNATMTCIGAACSNMQDRDSLEVSFSLREIGASLRSGERRHWICPWILTNLRDKGIIECYKQGTDRISFRFKDRNVKRIMTVAGQLLELRVAFALSAFLDDKGDPFFHDIRVGVVIDWEPDSNRTAEENRAVNEIDVVAMHGAMPIFISCKNGNFDSDELYKFNTVADLFGKEEVKKVFVAANIDHCCADPETIRERMDEMGIKRIENIHQKTAGALKRSLSGIFGCDSL